MGLFSIGKVKTLLAETEKQLAKITLPNKDEAYLRQRLLEMYANPARNYLKANA